MTTNVDLEKLQKDAVDIFNQGLPVQNLSFMRSRRILNWTCRMMRLL